jgi:hypothetical protein
MNILRNVLPVALLVLLVGASQNLFAANTTVGLCPGPGFHYTTIGEALLHTSVGGTVGICPGTYPEQVLVNFAVTLKGVAAAGADAAVIVPPVGGLVQNTTDVDTGNPIAAQILVQSTSAVSISNVTVDGTGNGIAACSPDIQGILFQNASGTLDHVAVRNQTPAPADGGCQIGEGIYVQTAAGFTSSLTVENSSVHNYNKNGITGNDTNTTLIATGNYVQGAGVVPSGGAAQNGIQLGFGATGKINSNTVIDNIYGDATVAASADILLYDTAEDTGITVNSNTVGNSQLPIALYTLGDDGGNLGDGVYVMGNKVFGTSVYDAIDVCTNGNIVTGNTIFNSAESGVHLDASCGAYFGGSTGNNNTATGNTILESACAGILADTGTSGNTTTPDTYYTVPFTITSSTSSCTIPGGAAMRAKAARKFSPAR